MFYIFQLNKKNMNIFDSGLAIMIHYQPGYGIIIAPCAPPVFKFKYLPKIEVLPSAITRNVKKSMLSSTHAWVYLVPSSPMPVSDLGKE